MQQMSVIFSQDLKFQEYISVMEVSRSCLGLQMRHNNGNLFSTVESRYITLEFSLTHSSQPILGLLTFPPRYYTLAHIVAVQEVCWITDNWWNFVFLWKYNVSVVAVVGNQDTNNVRYERKYFVLP